jgi:hypothetical protein
MRKRRKPDSWTGGKGIWAREFRKLGPGIPFYHILLPRFICLCRTLFTFSAKLRVLYASVAHRFPIPDQLFQSSAELQWWHSTGLSLDHFFRV